MLNHSRCPVGFSRLGPPYPSGWVGVLVQKNWTIARPPVRSPSPEKDTWSLPTLLERRLLLFFIDAGGDSIHSPSHICIQPLALIPFLHFTPLASLLAVPLKHMPRSTLLLKSISDTRWRRAHLATIDLYGRYFSFLRSISIWFVYGHGFARFPKCCSSPSCSPSSSLRFAVSENSRPAKSFANARFLSEGRF